MPPKKEVKKEVVEQPPKQVQPQIPPHELQGYGRFEYLNGSIYEGSWRLVKGVKTKHGQGVLTVPGAGSAQLGKEIYEGGWEEDLMSGHGTYHYADGSVYRGEWKRNEHSGKGVYEFANGTLYEGDWLNHLMHGTGYFIDHNGRKWEGEFRNGKFQSRRQKQLLKEKAIVVRKQAIKKEVTHVIGSILQAIAKSDKKTLKDNLSPFFASGQPIKEMVKDPYSKFDERPPEKWTDLLTNLKTNGEFKILSSSTEATIIPHQKIIAKQLQGAGQIVQCLLFKEQRNIKVALVNIEGSNWVIISVVDQQKKK